jgi:hypothetical protein
VRGRDGGDPLVQRYERVDDHESEAVVQQLLELVARLLREDDHGAVGGAVQQPLEQRDLALVLVQRRAEHEAHVLLVERLGHAAEDVGEVRVVDHRHRAADQPCLAGGEAPGAAVRRVAALAHDLLHEGAGLLRDVAAAVHDPGDGGDRDAREVGDLPDRRPASAPVAAVGACVHDRH